jgi:recombination protein RecR
MHNYPSELLTLIAHLKKFPGVGSKTAERFAFHLLNWSDEELKGLSEKIGGLKKSIYPCPECGCLIGMEVCSFCTPGRRDPGLMCLVSSPKDVFAIEETRAYRGLYHVVGAHLSPLEGRTPGQLKIEKLKARCRALAPREIIIALDSTLEGDTTSLFLREQLESLGFATTRLAFGLPMGSSLDFVDFGTLERAFTGRQRF